MNQASETGLQRRTREPFWLLQLTSNERSGAARDLQRMDAGRPRCNGLQLCSAKPHSALAHQPGASRAAQHLCPAALGRRRLAGWIGSRPLRSRARPADQHPLVRAVHLFERLLQQLSATARGTRDAGARFWWRVGRWLRARGRDDPQPLSRTRRRDGAGRLGDRMGDSRSLLCRFSCRAGSGSCVACTVLDWNSSGFSGVLHSRPCSGVQRLPGGERYANFQGPSSSIGYLLAGNSPRYAADLSRCPRRARRILRRYDVSSRFT